MTREFVLKQLSIVFILLALTAHTAFAQTTAFNFQGRLNDGANPANGNVELQFKLFDSLAGGTQIGATLLRPNVAVINGIFSTPLDFGAAAFDGSARFIEIGVRPAGSTNNFTTLNPRQPILSTPYAIQSKNAAQLGGIPASEYVTTTTVGSSFIRNATTQQTGNFNISGNGIVGGNLGIGTAPAAGIKLDVNGIALVRPGGIGGNIQFGNPNGETGMTIFNTNRADIKFDNSALRLVVGNGATPPLNTNGITVTRTGQVGIGRADNFGNVRLSVDATGSISNALGVTTDNPNGTGLVAGNSAGGQSAFFDGNIGINGTIAFTLMPTAGGITPLCLSSQFKVAVCSSSIRYKKDFQPFSDGLNFVNQLRPIAYKWKADNLPDIGFGAEEVAKINPLFVSYNQKGEVEGVKYDRLSVVFVNAFKEQQAQIEQQQKQIEQQRGQIENLKNLICLEHSDAAFCQEK